MQYATYLLLSATHECPYFIHEALTTCYDTMNSSALSPQPSALLNITNVIVPQILTLKTYFMIILV